MEKMVAPENTWSYLVESSAVPSVVPFVVFNN